MSGPNDWIRKKNSAPGNGSVGYGRPPVAKQFKPGQSGNPGGRKKGVKNVATIFNDALYRPVKIRIGGRVRTLPKIQAIVEVILNKALGGDTAAGSRIVELAHKLGGFQFLADSTSCSPNRESAYDRLARLIGAYSEDGAPLDAPGPSEGTSESNSDKKKAEE
jgi:Family of unknown function (DUF5681)